MKNKSLFIATLVILVTLIFSGDNYAQSDTTPPQLISFDFNPKSINTSNSPQTVTFTARITDNLSGATSVYVQFASPYTTFGNGGTLISGNALDGIYQGTVTFPRYSQSGTYNVLYIIVYDAASNQRTVSNNELVSLGFPTNLQVFGTQDISPPQLISFDFNPKSINTSNSPQTVTFTARITDNLSGATSVYVQFRSPSGQTFGNGGTLISGNALDGIYQGVVYFPQYSEPGTYNVLYITTSDQVSNFTTILNGDLISRGFPATLQVTASPTAASVTISGKVLNPNGRGVNKATVILTDSDGNGRSAVTNPFGYYRFTDVSVGSSYVLVARHKHFTFTQQFLSATEERNDLNFSAR